MAYFSFTISGGRVLDMVGMLSPEDMARFALSVLWGAILCGTGFLSVAFWLEAAADTTKDGATLVAFVLTALFIGALFWTLSAADLFHFWDWVGRRKN